MNAPLKNAVCNTCTLKLVTIAYRRAPWFRLVREPLKAGMRLLASLHRVRVEEYLVRTPACYDCIRFYKTALKEKSVTFRWLHRFINPAFDFLLERTITTGELRQSKSYARRATDGLSQVETEDWMRGMKTGL